MPGEALIKLGIPRQEVIIATKVRLRMGTGANQVGLSRLHMIDSVNDSLKRLQLSHIDLLYIQGFDPLTPLEETLRGLEYVVQSGKVRYLGVSNHPAWMIMKANANAEKMGWNQFLALNWVIRQPGVTSTIIGAKNLLYLSDNIAATTLQLTDEEMEQLNEVSILASEFPGWMMNRQLQGRFPE